MSRVGAVGGGAVASARRAAACARDFTIGAPADPAPPLPVAGPGGVSVAGLLAAGGAEAAPTPRDRAARTRAHDLLRALAGLQAALTASDAASAPALRTLAALLADVPDADDPRLRDAVAQVRLRAAIELARPRAV